jgi:hypothetical protein
VVAVGGERLFVIGGCTEAVNANPASAAVWAFVLENATSPAP